MFSMQFLNPLIATFHLSSAASLNFGRSQNGLLGSGLSRLENIAEKVGNSCGQLFLPFPSVFPFVVAFSFSYLFLVFSCVSLASFTFFFRFFFFHLFCLFSLFHSFYLTNTMLYPPAFLCSFPHSLAHGLARSFNHSFIHSFIQFIYSIQLY